MSRRSQLRAEALERAGGRCEFPGCDMKSSEAVNPLEMAHLTGVGMGGSRTADALDNVAILCQYHHGWLDGRLMPNGRRFENEQVLRGSLTRRRNP